MKNIRNYILELADEDIYNSFYKYIDGNRNQKVSVFLNPNYQELASIIRFSTYQVLRGFIDIEDKDIYVWDASESTHPNAHLQLAKLGVNFTIERGNNIIIHKNAHISKLDVEPFVNDNYNFRNMFSGHYSISVD